MTAKSEKSDEVLIDSHTGQELVMGEPHGPAYAGGVEVVPASDATLVPEDEAAAKAVDEAAAARKAAAAKRSAKS